jgi:hypothetical protein
MAKSVKRSMALKGNTNAKGSGKGGMRTGVIGGVFGLGGSFATGAISANRARKQSTAEASKRIMQRQHKGVARSGAVFGGAAGGLAGALGGIAGGAARGAIIGGGVVGAIGGAVVQGGANYLASKAGAYTYKKIRQLKHARHKN